MADPLKHSVMHLLPPGMPTFFQEDVSLLVTEQYVLPYDESSVTEWLQVTLQSLPANGARRHPLPLGFPASERSPALQSTLGAILHIFLSTFQAPFLMEPTPPPHIAISSSALSLDQSHYNLLPNMKNRPPQKLPQFF